VLELTNARGEKRYATVVSLSADAATLALGSREFTFPLNEIEPFWDGGFMVLWKKPTLSSAIVEPGMWGKNVAWVRQRLDVIDGKAAEPRPREAYDEDLQRRVTAFQRSRSLTPDGIVGEETLAHLASFGRDNRPSLTVEKP